MVEQSSSTVQVTPEIHHFSTSSQMIGQAILSAISFIMKVQPEPGSISITCYPGPSSESGPFQINSGKRSGNQRTSAPACQYNAVRIEPVDKETSQGLDTSRAAQ